MRRRNSEGKRTRTSHLQNTIPNQQSTRLQQMRRPIPRRRRTLGYSITQKIPLKMLGGYADMSQHIKQLQTFLTGAKPAPITYPHQFQKPKPKIGRPSERLSRDQLKQAMRICEFDVMKQGRIYRWRCPFHGDQSLSYRYQRGDGVHAWCEVPGCMITTHWDEYHYRGSDVIIDNGRLCIQEEP